jgi:hypothetical protein
MPTRLKLRTYIHRINLRNFVARLKVPRRGMKVFLTSESPSTVDPDTCWVDPRRRRVVVYLEMKG